MFLLWGKHIRKYYLRYLIFFLIGLFSLVAVDYFQLKIPEIIGQIVDKMKEDGFLDIHSAFFTSLIVDAIIIAAVIFVGRILWRLSLFYASKKMEEKIRFEMFKKAQELDVSYYKSNKIGNIMNWFTSDIETLEEFLGWGTLMMIDGVFLTILALSKMFILNYSLAFITLFPILLIAIWAMFIEKRMSNIWKLRQESTDSLYDFSQENFTGIRVIKAFVKERQQIRAFDKLALQNKDINIKFTLISVLFDVVIELIIALVCAIILGFGGWFVYQSYIGQPINIFNKDIIIKPGELITFFGYFFSLIWPMIALGQVITMFSRAHTSYKRIARFLDSEVVVKDKEDALDIKLKGEITFNHFSFRFPDGNFDSLDDISLTIKEGEHVGIIGNVGSGKSTLVNVLLRLYNLEENSLLFDGHDVMSLKIDDVRRDVAIAPQDNFLFSDTIGNNIAFNDVEVDKNNILQAAEFSDIANDVAEFENKYETELGENGHTISGGQKQRISIARAYLKNAPILILDDSVSAVDLKTENSILSHIKERRKGKTTILVASRVSTVMNLDKIIVLNKGKLEAFDTPKNLLKTSETYQRMILLQKLDEKKGVNDGK